jgi:tetratricopeptide (TPR) repeat protein
VFRSASIPLRAAFFVAVAGQATATASPGDADDSVEASPPMARATSKAAPKRAAKAVPFDPHWLDPFFTGPLSRQAANDFRQERWAAAETGFGRAIAKLPPGADERNAARYLAALAMANQSKWALAASSFQALARDYPRLLPYHAYNAARCLLRAGQTEAALTWAAKVPAGTVPAAEAALVRLDGLRALNKTRDVADAAAAYPIDFPSGPRRPEALFRRAEALEKLATETKALEIDADLPDITALYRRVWAEVPLDPWSERATERLNAIALALPPYEAKLVRTHIASEWVTRGMVYFDRNRNSESEAAFTSALGAPGLTPELECRARYHLAQSVWKLRQRTRAAPLFDAAEGACARAGNTDLHAKALPRRCATSASRPSTPSTATPTTRACGKPSWPRTRGKARRPPSC